MNPPSNNRVNAPVRPVTPLASASVAPVRPARYAARWAVRNETAIDWGLWTELELVVAGPRQEDRRR